MAHTKKVTAYMALKPSDIGGRYHVQVKITPLAQNQDRMARAQLVQGLRAPGTDGRPLLDDLTLLEDIWEADDPGLIFRRLREQTLLARSQEIGKVELAASEQEWLENNAALVKLADKRLNPEGKQPLTPEDEQTMMRIMDVLKNGGDMNTLMQMLGMAEGANGLMPGMEAPAGAPMGVDPSVMPSQMNMKPEDVLPNSVTLPNKQARRGKPAN